MPVTSNLHCIASRLRENLICSASETWNLEIPLQSSFSRPEIHTAIEGVGGTNSILKIAYFSENYIGTDYGQCRYTQGKCF
jgi:hypothetical protein